MTSDDDPALRRVPTELSKAHTLETLLQMAEQKGDVLLTGNSSARRWWCSIYCKKDRAGESRFVGQNARPASRPHGAVYDALEDFIRKEQA
jgi:hypothetical protein